MDKPTLMTKTVEFVEVTTGTSYVVVRKDEIIEILKTLEGLKRKLQPLTK